MVTRGQPGMPVILPGGRESPEPPDPQPHPWAGGRVFRGPQKQQLLSRKGKTVRRLSEVAQHRLCATEAMVRAVGPGC